MSGPTFAQVRQFTGAQLDRAAHAWQRLADRVRDRAEAMVPALSAAEEAWDGGAAVLARRRARQLWDRVDAALLPVRRHHRILGDLARAGRALAAHARDLEARATSAGLRIGPDGTVTPAGIHPEFAAAALTSFQRQVAEVLAAAARLDAETARQLAESAPWPPGQDHVFVPRAAIPPPGTDPTMVHRWWQQLDPAARRYLLATHPALVGALDGVPVEVRDHANRAVLPAAREELTTVLAGIEAALSRPLPPGRSTDALRLRRERAAVQEKLYALELIEAQLATESPDGQRSYLLSLDVAGDGRVVLAIGNPDHADNVVTLVPGTFSRLGNIASDLDRTVRMVADANALAPEQRTAGVYWLDYDAPGSLLAAAGGGHARRATDDLRRFADGVRATGGDAHHTVLGHSYGSTVVGHTAADGLSADSLVFLGSPGVGVGSATDLRIDTDPSDHVWSSTAAWDVIVVANPQPVAAALSHLGGGPLVAAGVVPNQWHGTNPSSAAFGGQVFTADPGGHSSYWDEGNVAREHLARITTGHHHEN